MIYARALRIAVYCRIEEDEIEACAVSDCRRDPAWREHYAFVQKKLAFIFRI